MALSESQLQTWSHQGAISQSRDTYATIRRALEDRAAGYANKSYEIFLQGSYGNDTNVYAESDVDVVIRLDSTYFHTFLDAPVEQQAVISREWTRAAYQYPEFKADVYRLLANRFGWAAKAGNKAITIEAEGGRRKADVIVAALFKQYYAAPQSLFAITPHPLAHEGICFFTSGDVQIVNFPKQHSANCTAKHQQTNGWFKPMVRVFKNWRNSLVERGTLQAGIAPSYFIEGLLYNIPGSVFNGNYSTAVSRCLSWLESAPRDNFVCANERYYLLRDYDHNCWPPANYDAFIRAVRQSQ